MKNRILLLTVAGLLCGGMAMGAAAPAGWVTLKHPAGFVVRHPKGWAVTTADDGLVTVHSADKTRSVQVQPFFMRQPVGALQWVTGVPKLLAKRFPNAELVSTRRARKKPDEVFAMITYRAGNTAMRAKLLCSVHGPSGMLYVVTAPDREFARRLGTLVKVLKTFSYGAPAASHRKAAGPMGVAWVKWKDPKQGAFLTEVPKGWKVIGGMFHRNAVDPRAAMAVTSPDGKIAITGGDVQVPAFTLPTPMLTRTGFREGAMYSPGYGVQMMVMRYLPGANFVQWYVKSRLPKDCTGLKFLGARSRDDAVKAINKVYSTYRTFGVNTKLHAGEAAFTCTRGGKEQRGYYFASTSLTTGFGGGGIWKFEALYGYMAEAGREKEAQAILSHIVKSFQLNPQWVAKQRNLTANVSKIVSSTHEHISKTISDTYWGRQKVQDDLMRKWSNTMLGQTDVVDPTTGEKWKVSSGSNYYWRRDHTNEIAGTRTYDRPDTDFTPLEEW